MIKSGTNSFHGDVNEFLRNEVLDAANSTVKQQGFGREPYKQNQFGVTFGGPIAKNRTFFFADYEGLRTREGLILNGTIPTQSMTGGDFSAMRSEEHTSELQSQSNLVCRLLLEKKNRK